MNNDWQPPWEGAYRVEGPPAVDGIAAKIVRADRHLKDLEVSIDAYLAPPEPYAIRGEEYMEGDMHSQALFLEVSEFPPDEKWGPLIGDFVHNLRSALDHLAWAIALPQAKAAAPDKVGFPISRPDWEKTTADRIARRLAMFPVEARAVIKELQPYQTGDSLHPLWILQKLWNADKHRTIHTAGYAFIPADSATSDHPLDIPGGWSCGRLDARTQPMACRSTNWPQGTLQEFMDVYVHSAKDVTFGYPGEDPPPEYPFAGLPVRRVLRRLSEIVVLEAIEPLRRFIL